MSKKIDPIAAIEKCKLVHSNKYDYSESVITTSISLIKIKCPIHEYFIQTISSHLRGHGCNKCAREVVKNKIKSTFDDFKKTGIKKHNGFYSYPTQNYIHNKEKLSIECPIHGLFLQSANTHLRGSGCKDCGAIKKKKSLLSNISDFIKKADKVYNKKYNYELFVYINATTNSVIICPDHGSFMMSPNRHLTGYACPKCSAISYYNKRSLGKDKFIESANQIHKNKYSYNDVNYINYDTKVSITCKDHGIFLQTPHGHLNGQGCKKCSKLISRGESSWLDCLNIFDRQVKIKLKNKKYPITVDGFDPITNTVYEFYGDFWHGNPKRFDHNKINVLSHKTFGEIYKKTIVRENLIKDAGYNLITIWESDWENRDSK